MLLLVIERKYTVYLEYLEDFVFYKKFLLYVSYNFIFTSYLMTSFDLLIDCFMSDSLHLFCENYFKRVF